MAQHTFDGRNSPLRSERHARIVDQVIILPELVSKKKLVHYVTNINLSDSWDFIITVDLTPIVLKEMKIGGGRKRSYT